MFTDIGKLRSNFRLAYCIHFCTNATGNGMRFFFLPTPLQSRLASLALDGTQFKKENSEFSNYEETSSLSFPGMQSNSQMIKKSKLEAVESHNLEGTWHKIKTTNGSCTS